MRKKNPVRNHLKSHADAWLNFCITIVAVAMLLHGGMTQGAELLGFKWAQVAASQVAAHLLILFLYGFGFKHRDAEKVDRLCVVALRLGFAYCFALGG